MTGYCVSLNSSGPLVAWKTKRQPTVALSTCEAEYMALAVTMQECIYLQQLFEWFDGQKYKCNVYEDNQGAIALARNPVHRQRCKHVDIKYHFIRSLIDGDKISLEYYPTNVMVADILTKPATKLKLTRFEMFLFGTWNVFFFLWIVQWVLENRILLKFEQVGVLRDVLSLVYCAPFEWVLFCCGSCGFMLMTYDVWSCDPPVLLITCSCTE